MQMPRRAAEESSGGAEEKTAPLAPQFQHGVFVTALLTPQTGLLSTPCQRIK